MPAPSSAVGEETTGLREVDPIMYNGVPLDSRHADDALHVDVVGLTPGNACFHQHRFQLLQLPRDC